MGGLLPCLRASVSMSLSVSLTLCQSKDNTHTDNLLCIVCCFSVVSRSIFLCLCNRHKRTHLHTPAHIFIRAHTHTCTYPHAPALTHTRSVCLYVCLSLSRTYSCFSLPQFRISLVLSFHLMYWKDVSPQRMSLQQQQQHRHPLFGGELSQSIKDQVCLLDDWWRRLRLFPTDRQTTGKKT